MSNNTPIVVDNRLQGLTYREALDIDPDTLEADLASFIYQIWYHAFLLLEARWAEAEKGMDKWNSDWESEEGEGPWEAAMAAYNS